jgi:hypothetical protein
MLRIASIEEIEALLLQLPDLIRLQERRSPEFADDTTAWLSSLENAFTANRLYQAAAVATLRSGLIAAEHGHLPDGLEFRGRPTRSRVMVALASHAIQRAVDLASTVVAENRPRLAESERVAQQIVAAVRSRESIPAREEGVTNTQYLRMLRRSLSASADLENAMVHLEGLVGPNDALVLLDRALAVDLEVSGGDRQPGHDGASES